MNFGKTVVFIFEIRTFIIFLEEHNVGKKWKSKDEDLGTKLISYMGFLESLLRSQNFP